MPSTVLNVELDTTKSPQMVAQNLPNSIFVLYHGLDEKRTELVVCQRSTFNILCLLLSYILYYLRELWCLAPLSTIYQLYLVMNIAL
jgi:hypothetical protein